MKSLNKNTISKLIIFLIMLLDVNFFYLTQLSNIKIKIRIIVIILLSLFLVLINYRKLKNYKKGIFCNAVWLYVVITIIQLIISKETYQQSLIQVLIAGSYNFTIIVYFGLYYYMRKYDSITFIEKVIVYFTLILSTLFLAQWLIYGEFNSIFLSISNTGMRFGSLRIIESGNFIEFGVIMSFGLLLSKQRKISKKICSITGFLGMLEIIFVAKGRIGTLIVFITIFLIIMFFKKNIVHRILMSFMVCSIILVIFQLPVTSRYINSFYSGSDVISTSARIGEVYFFTNNLKENPIWGRGFIYYNTEADDNYYTLVGRDVNKYYRTDVGLIGFADEFGMVGVMWYLYVVILIIKVILNICRNKNIYYNMEVYGVSILIILQSFNTLVLDDPARIIHLPILLTFVEFINYQNIINKEK